MEPGIGIAAAKFLTDHHVVAVGSDNWAVEVIPFENPKIIFGIHQHLLTNNGVHIIENARTDLIAEEAARTGRATFFFSMTVPKAVGTTGIFVAPEAIR
jgi:kynurenine formamidase